MLFLRLKKGFWDETKSYNDPLITPQRMHSIGMCKTFPGKWSGILLRHTRTSKSSYFVYQKNSSRFVFLGGNKMVWKEFKNICKLLNFLDILTGGEIIEILREGRKTSMLRSWCLSSVLGVAPQADFSLMHACLWRFLERWQDVWPFAWLQNRISAFLMGAASTIQYLWVPKHPFPQN